MTCLCMEIFLAAYGSTSNTITFTLFALALYPEVQTKLRQEMNHLVKNRGLKTLTEILRKFPVVSRLERTCLGYYEDCGLRVNKGIVVGIPVTAIHHDKKHYHNPDGFDPEHFSEQKKAERSPYAFLPFGGGPRCCLGQQFALTMVKSAVAHIVRAFRIESTKNTPRNLHGLPDGVNLVPPRNSELRLTPLNNN